MEENNQLYHSVVAWINKLQNHEIHKEKLIQNILDLRDGIILAKLFNYSVPQNYRVDESQMYTDDIDNWAFTLKNLNIIYDAIQVYNQDIHQKSTQEIEFLSIFNEDNKSIMLQLVEEIFAIILQSEIKNEFITAIIDLDEDDQERLSHFIKKLLKVNAGYDKSRLDTDYGLDDHLQHMDSGFKSQQSKESIKQFDTDKELLKKIDELEFEQSKEKKRFESVKVDNETLKLKLNSFQEQVEKKDVVIDKLIKQRDQFLNSTRCQSFDEVEQELKNKQIKIQEINKIIDEMKYEHEEQVRNLKDEIILHEKRLEKFKNYDKMVETIKTLSEENKYLEKRVQECDKLVDDLKKRNTELSQKVQDKEEMMKKKFEQKQLVQKNVELETELGTKSAECQQFQNDIYELQQINQKQEDSIKALNKKIQELHMKSSEKKKALTPTKRNLSSDFNDMVNKLEMHEYYRQQQKHKSETFFPRKDNIINPIDEEDSSRKQIPTDMEDDHHLHQTPVQHDQENQDYEPSENEEKLKDMEENYELLQLENEKLRSQIKKIQQDIAKKSSVSDQYKQVNALQEDNAKLESQVAILQKKCQQTSLDSDEDKSKIIKNLQETIKSLKERLAFLQDENKEMKESSQSQEQVEKIKIELQKCKKQIDYTKIEFEDKRKQLEEEIKLLVSVISEIRMKQFDQNQEQGMKQQSENIISNNSQVVGSMLQNTDINRQSSINSTKTSSLKQ